MSDNSLSGLSEVHIHNTYTTDSYHGPFSENRLNDILDMHGIDNKTAMDLIVGGDPGIHTIVFDKEKLTRDLLKDKSMQDVQASRTLPKDQISIGGFMWYVKDHARKPNDRYQIEIRLWRVTSNDDLLEMTITMPFNDLITVKREDKK